MQLIFLYGCVCVSCFYVVLLCFFSLFNRKFMSSLFSCFLSPAKPAPLKNCTLRPYTSTATTTLLVSNLTTIYGYHNVKELNYINSNNAGSHHYGSTAADHLSEMVGDAAVPVVPIVQNSNNGGGRKILSSSSSSSEMQFNLMEQDNNKSKNDRKIIVNKREVNNNDNNSKSRDRSDNYHQRDTDIYRSHVYNSDNNNENNLSERMKNTTNYDDDGESEKITTKQMRIVNRIIRNEVPLKYNNNDNNFNNVNSNKNNDKSGGGSDGGIYAAALTQHLNQHHNYHDPFDTASTTYETRQSSSSPTTMELECIAGYDGGLPQHFILEAYDSRTRKLRLNVTSAYTDVPLFRFDLSGKLIK